MKYETADNTDDTVENEISVRIRVNPCPSVVHFFRVFRVFRGLS